MRIDGRRPDDVRPRVGAAIDGLAPRIAVGTCGFSYREWIGVLYATGTKPSEMLAHYARRFAVVEIDSSYYGVPTAATVASWAKRAPEGFRFSAKLPSAATHAPVGSLGAIHADVGLFVERFSQLARADKFVCALAQFPHSFRPDERTTAYLGRLREALGAMRVVAEFRHREWQTDATLDALRSLEMGVVAVDEPEIGSLMRPASDATTDLAYVRFHGRNEAEWWDGDNASRYEYLYDARELASWVERVRELASRPGVREILAFFNNHRRGNAVRNAEAFEALLAERFGAAAIDRPTGDGDGQIAFAFET